MSPRRQQYRAPEEDDMERLTVRAPAPVIQGLQEIADQQGASLNLIVNKAFLDFLMDNGSPATEGLARSLAAMGVREPQ
jgi:hypothetical protein